MRLLKTVAFMCLLGVFCVQTKNLTASDSALLDTLVAKGTLTSSEATEIKKNSVLVVFDKSKAQKVRISARFQLQYEYAQSELLSGAGAPKDGTGLDDFIVRRAFIGADANLGGGWDAKVTVDFARTRLAGIFVDTYLSKSIDYEYLSGKLYLGYMRVGFCHEDMMTSFKTNAIELSAASSYWAMSPNGRRLGVGNRYVGVRWNGDVKQVKGLSYIAAVTNSFQLSPVYEDELAYNWQDNKLAYWLSLHYTLKDEDYKLTFGVYSMYSATANKQLGLADAASIYSINPYISGNVGRFHFWTEYMASGVSDGKKNSFGQYQQANPYGINACVEYRFDIGEQGELGPTFRYSWLDTNGRGVQISDAIRNVGNVGGLFDNIQDFYVGVNWYINGDDLKIQLGAEYAQYSGSINSSAEHFAEGYAVRLRFQMRM